MAMNGNIQPLRGAAIATTTHQRNGALSRSKPLRTSAQIEFDQCMRAARSIGNSDSSSGSQHSLIKVIAIRPIIALQVIMLTK
jgi:hypothetical protein